MDSTLAMSRKAEVSPWFALLGLFYPVCETLFSGYRRRVLKVKGRSPNLADALHLHTLIYHRVVRWFVGSRSSARFAHGLEAGEVDHGPDRMVGEDLVAEFADGALS